MLWTGFWAAETLQYQQARVLSTKTKRVLPLTRRSMRFTQSIIDDDTLSATCTKDLVVNSFIFDETGNR